MTPTRTSDIKPAGVKAGVDLERVRAAVGPVLSAHGVVLVNLEWRTDRAGWVLRLTIEREGIGHPGDRPGAVTDGFSWGVTLEDCAEVSRDTSAVLDVEDLIPHHYNLEVSSPGLDRPLRTEAELARFAGRTVKVKLARPAPDGQRVLRGTLDAAPAGRVAVVVDGKRVEVPFVDLAEANLVFELTPQPKKKGAAASAKGKKSGDKPKSVGRPEGSS